jgi:transcriptional regulator with XRE-family HTH domain
MGLESQVRNVVLKQIAAGKLSVGLVARRSGYGEAQISNFLRGHRGLSVASLEALIGVAGYRVEIFPERLGNENIFDNSPGRPTSGL